MNDKLPFDEKYFENLKKQGIELPIDEVFKKIHQENHWGDGESVSGQGSNREQTATISVEIPKLLAELGVQTLLDAPCGDFGWISKIDLPIKNYIGADIVPEVIAKHNALFAVSELSVETKATMELSVGTLTTAGEGGDLEGETGEGKRVEQATQYNFIVLDITQDDLPEAEVMLCRDCLVHLSFADIQRFIQNLKRSKIKYFLTTTFSERTENKDIATGDWRTLNLEIAPFYFPKPLKVINENCTEGNGKYADKSLTLWKITDI